MELIYFGKIDLTNLRDTYDGTVEFENFTVRLDLNFESKSIDQERLKPIANVLENLEKVVKEIRKYIVDDLKGGEDVIEFTDFHFEELDEDELTNLLQNTDENLSKEEQLLSATNLNRIGFYPENEEVCVFDIMLNEEISNYILVVNLDVNLNLSSITMES